MSELKKIFETFIDDSASKQLHEIQSAAAHILSLSIGLDKKIKQHNNNNSKVIKKNNKKKPRKVIKKKNLVDTEFMINPPQELLDNNNINNEYTD